MRIFTLIACIALLNACSSVMQADSSIPTDKTLIDRYSAKKVVFSRLISMSDEDPNVVRIAQDFTWVKGEKKSGEMGRDRPIGFSIERWGQYRDIFKELDVESGLVRSESGNLIMLLAETRGIVPSGFTKGYMFTRQTNDCTEATLDDVELLADRKFACRRIDENWSLYIER